MENPPPKPAKNDLPAVDPLAGDLPDIIDLVMEMGRASDPEPENLRSPALQPNPPRISSS